MPPTQAHPTARRGIPPQSPLSPPAVTVRFQFVDSYHSPTCRCDLREAISYFKCRCERSLRSSLPLMRRLLTCTSTQVQVSSSLRSSSQRHYLRILPGRFFADCFPEISPISPPLLRIASASISSTCSFSRIDTTAVSCALCNR